MERLRFEGPDPDFTRVPGFSRRKLFSGGHGGDEYGNCTLYFRCPLFGIIWWYPTGHYQADVELPGPGECTWVDRVFYE